MNLQSEISEKNLPQHIAIIMDGNGRWAKKHGKRRILGHKKGTEAVRNTVECCAELGVRYLTLYAFSTENWLRPKLEVSALMGLLVDALNRELKTLLKNHIALRAIGDLDALPAAVKKKLNQVIDATANNNRMTLILALSYSARWEITQALRKIAADVSKGKLKVAAVSEQLVNQYLSTSGIPDPELLIRTSGEHRLSNFLLWQSAYSEFYFTDVLWPDFDRNELYRAIIDYQSRERRFGKTSEQISTEK